MLSWFLYKVRVLQLSLHSNLLLHLEYQSNNPFDRSMDKDEVIETLRRPSLRSQAKELEGKVVGLRWEIKKMPIVEEEPKNETNNYGEE